ncbi:MAG: amidohydrolase, partial [Phycisphaerales bacterium]|nr:amidohydrolase [Phycisphaerales bacterium]
LVSRRDFVAAVGCGALVGLAQTAAAELNRDRELSQQLVDTNVSISRWPLRRLPCDETAKLVEKLRGGGVTSAWAGTFDGLLHKDVRAANARLAAECRRNGDGILVPFGSINPMRPDWEEDLRLCAEEHRMPGVRLHPNYHGYKLDDSLFARLMSLAVERGLIVQIALHMEDERMMHPLMRVEPVNAAPLADLMPRWKGARVVLLNALNLLDGDQLTRLLLSGEVFVEIAFLEGVGGLDRLLTTVPLDRILFGSHAPLFYFESAALKLRESALSAAQLAAIRYKNAERLHPSKEAIP